MAQRRSASSRRGLAQVTQNLGIRPDASKAYSRKICDCLGETHKPIDLAGRGIGAHHLPALALVALDDLPLKSTGWMVHRSGLSVVLDQLDITTAAT
jgi:hypothetical protein